VREPRHPHFTPDRRDGPCRRDGSSINDAFDCGHAVIMMELGSLRLTSRFPGTAHLPEVPERTRRGIRAMHEVGRICVLDVPG